ncbi:MAG: hypothetical protein Unbinned8472contig1000_38 [Prokaryotic dsDNA virus sp.]|nr:MAG: hypothetical protein Unbinned8472contig1000_38 [Prokaryotic dsDNA virus sp.]|tara:strand:- start:474 stop:836 length:363 start_codon:yes stop_codon:yes gene_type:complete
MKALLTAALLAVSTMSMATQPTTIDSVWTDGVTEYDLRKVVPNKYKVKDKVTKTTTTCDLTHDGGTSGYMEISNCVITQQGTFIGTLPLMNYNYNIIDDVLYLEVLYVPGNPVVPFILVK